jgi:hypothetical protein
MIYSLDGRFDLGQVAGGTPQLTHAGLGAYFRSIRGSPKSMTQLA